MTAKELIQKFPDLYEIHTVQSSEHQKDIVYWLMIETKDGTYERIIGSQDERFGGVEFIPDKKGELGTIFM